MGFAMGPLTVIMIRALPRSKQGVASSINSTARELGGAFGVAILGSISAPIYAASVRPATDLLPANAAGPVHDSLAEAGVVASYLPPAQGEALLNMARAAFVDAMGAAVLVGAIVAIGGAIVAFAFLPGRSAAVAAGATTTAGGAEAPALVPAELEPAA